MASAQVEDNLQNHVKRFAREGYGVKYTDYQRTLVELGERKSVVYTNRRKKMEERNADERS